MQQRSHGGLANVKNNRFNVSVREKGDVGIIPEFFNKFILWILQKDGDEQPSRECVEKLCTFAVVKSLADDPLFLVKVGALRENSLKNSPDAFGRPIVTFKL